MGPPKKFSMMRYESKHSVFKTMRRKIKNVRVINKTLAFKHQRTLVKNGFSYKDDIKFGKKIPLSINDDVTELLRTTASYDKTIFFTKTMQLNNYKYREGLVVNHEGNLYEINRILFIDEDCHLCCRQLEVVGFSQFYNSIHFKAIETTELTLILFDDLKNKKSYESKVVDSEKYIICDTLHLRQNALQNLI